MATIAAFRNRRPTAAQRWRSWRWVILTLVVLAVIAGVDAYLTAPRPGARMDPASTGPDGAHALVALLRDGGVDVVVADGIADVERAARPDTLILVAQSQYLTDPLLDRLAKSPGDLLLVEPTARTREALMPGLRISARQHLRQRPQLHSARGHSGRAGSIRAQRHLPRHRRPGDDQLLRRRADPLPGRRADHHRGRQHRLHDQRRACCRRATPRWR